MTLGIVYHMPFWRDAGGTLHEVEGSFARYVDSLAPYFDEISLCVPVLDRPAGEGSPIRSSNVTLAPLPAFDGPVQFYPRLTTILPRLSRWVRGIDLLHCRIPSPAAVFAFAFARRLGRPAFVLVVGDLRALLPSMPYRGLKRILWRAYTGFEELNVQWMTDGSLAFANGGALTAKHARPNHPVIETTTTTIREADVGTRPDTCTGPGVRALTVSRVDPRKGLSILPPVVRLLADRGTDLTVDIVGPAVGKPGARERAGIEAESRQLRVADRVRFRGALALDQLLPMYADYDLFLLPTLPGEGIPRVLLEAMSAGLPVITTRVAGIPSLIAHEQNGLLMGAPTVDAAVATITRLVADPALRRTLIANGYATARAHTLEKQARAMMEHVAEGLNVTLRQPGAAPFA